MVFCNRGKPSISNRFGFGTAYATIKCPAIPPGITNNQKKGKQTMKMKTYENEIRAAVARALGHYGVTPEDVQMPCSVAGPVSVDLHRDLGSTFRTWALCIPNWQLAEMIHGDAWDGDAEDSAFRFGGGGYDPVWFECGVNG